MSNLFLFDEESTRAALIPHLPDWSFSRTPIEGDWKIVLRWGNTAGSEQYPLALNPVSAINATHIAGLFQRTISISGISHTAPNINANAAPWLHDIPGLRNRYQIGVFDLSVIFVQDNWVSRQEGGSIYSGELKMLKELAMRAVYALGLDFGVVHIGLQQKTRQPVIIGIDPAPRLSNSTALRFAGALRRYSNYMGQLLSSPMHRPPVAIGADPEFILARGDTLNRIYASDFLPLTGPVGCEMQPVHANGRSHRPLAELRPEYALTPVRLFNNLKSTIRRADQMIPKGISWLAGSVPDGTYPIGGHIHFSRVPLSTRLLRALDNYLTIPLLLMEDPVRAVIRRSRYGFLGDARVKPHGGFEYRTPFSWLSNPVLARGTLCLAYLVAKEHVRLQSNVFTDINMLESFYAADKEPFRRLFPTLWSEIEQTATYEAYSQSLQGLYDLIDSGWVVDEKADFRREWQSGEGA